VHRALGARASTGLEKIGGGGS